MEGAYQLFKPEDVITARMIRLQQTLGYTLGEILALNEEYRAGEHSSERTVEILQLQIGRLQQRKDALEAALTFLHRKVEWVKAGKTGPAPRLEDNQL
ncbi:MerR family transcriptional regulator [Chthonobacter albigriseus]|uniref:MerR family transcriptional regulator n=1 Tax=Chthonobacter albigriseus TaxID=1683161 RepID=UPI001FCEC4A2|nr:MerR family transcriptional regulator [Chthonobacter albigriseus]